MNSDQKRSPELETVAKCWDTTAAQRTANPIRGWMDSPLVWDAYVLPKLGAGPGRHWLVAAVERHGISRTGHWLSLGCGAAGTEIAAAGWGLFASMQALDASTQSLEIARRAAAEQAVTRIEFGGTDLNRLTLPPEAFDAVLMNMSLHHVRNLRHALAEVRRSLRPGGFFLANEFVGPRQFQFTDLQLSMVREVLAVLPERFRRDSITGQIKKDYVRMPLEHWNVADPSEAIRSDEILAEIDRQFRIVERLDYGGTLLHLLLENIVHNFDAGDPESLTTISLLGRFEDLLIRHGVIPSDFTFVVAQPRRRLGRLRRMAGL